MGTRWNRLIEAVLTSTQNLCFEQKYEKYQNFLSEHFHFLVVKFSVYSNRHVFVMVQKRYILVDIPEDTGIYRKALIYFFLQLLYFGLFYIKIINNVSKS